MRSIAADLQSVVQLAHSFADTAGAMSMQWFRTRLDIDTKADASPVTIVDQEVERLLRASIGEHFPTHGILGEEHGRDRIDAEYVWVVDPIDGTRSFITGSPLWGTLLALLRQGRPQVGMIDMPALEERWVGCAGQPTRFNGVDCHTSGCTRLDQARVYATSPDAFTATEWAAFDAVSRAAQMRRFGGDCHSYGLLASGHVDLVIEAELQPYDYLALVPIVEGAGGVITDWRGKALNIRSDGRVVAAATPELHHQVISQLAEPHRG
ncbi:histidinol-phosphatase [Noviherbaspirillum saxi]|uniref:Histidinol-phosphatase n=1 Tax=Noviherbaspirillum saxi TaxID=2320863 RepID=A0A3A3FHB6_9BURK|nr:histidinol-phosphatase [Noviherbaspirillum saxi]RJF92781.1 histidinol-phosphatase [Noviherbaspirillum saxi]